jgi:hypothetical protein
MSDLGNMIIRDVYSALPAAGIFGRLFFASDTHQILRDNGTTWDDVTPSGGATNPTINTQTASYTLVLGDNENIVEMNVAGANTLTVPPNSAVAFAIGATIVIRQYGAGATTITAGAGVTIRTPGTLIIQAQYGMVTIQKRATDEWTLEGRC